nr:hypothetical protein [Tanacetum cinerariifolium]
TSTIALVISSAAPVVETTIITSPTRLCGLIPYLDSDSPDEMASPERVSPRSSDHRSYSSSLSLDSALVHSSGLDAPDQAHSGSLTRVVSPRLGYPLEDTEIDTTEIEDGRDLDIVDGDYVRDHIKVDLRDDREEFEASAGDTVMLGIDPRSVPMVEEKIIKPVGGDSSSLSST